MLFLKKINFIIKQTLKGKINKKWIISKIRNSGLFDEEWYLNQYPDVKKASMCPIAHYVNFGVAEGRRPHPFFDTYWYLNHNPDVQRATCIPFVHFILHGAQEGRVPNSEFNVFFYLQENKDVAVSNISPVVHFFKWGYRENRIYSNTYLLEKTTKNRSKLTQFLEEALCHYKSEDQNLIIVFGHEATRTGAPIALLGVIKNLLATGRFYFITILNRGGALSQDYQETCPTLILEKLSESSLGNLTFYEWIAEYFSSSNTKVTCLTNTAELKEAAEVFGKKNIKVVSLIHEMPTAINEYFGGHHTMKIFEKYAECLIVPSQLTYQCFMKKYAIVKEIKIVHPGVKFSYFQKDIPFLVNKIRNQLKIKNNTPLIVSCGSYEDRKGFDLFIKIGSKMILDCARSNQEIPRFLWIGSRLSGEYAQQQIATITNKIVKKHFIFLNDRENVEEIIAAADVFLLCSREDPFPLVAIEAAGYEVPIVLFSETTGTEFAFPKGSYYAVKKFDIDLMCKAIEKAFKRIEYQSPSQWVRRNLSITKYAEEIGAELLAPKGKVAHKLTNKRRVLLIGYGPPPILGTKSEGSGLRLWGLAQALAKELRDHEVILAYKVALVKHAPTGHHEGVQVIRWEDATIKENINKATTVLFSYCLGQDTEHLISLTNPEQQVILDCYVPIFSEVCARQSGDLEQEKKHYLNDLNYWNNSLRHGDVFLCANQNQAIYYQGILSSLGRINPLNYGKPCIRLVPYGIPDTLPLPKTQPFSSFLKKERKHCFRLLWFGGVYPWFNTHILLEAIAIISKQHDVVLAMVGAKNPFVQHELFHAKVQELEKGIQQLGLQDYVYLFDWVEYEQRADWYTDCDLIITINKEGVENSLSWRTRLVDYVWSAMPVATNGGDPLGEELIKAGAAVRLDITSPENLAKTILAAVSDSNQLAKMKEAMMLYRPKLHWSNLVKDLVYDIKSVS